MIKTAPRGPHQSEAVVRAMAHDGFLIFAEQRTGKCWITLSILDQRKPKHLWIICPIAAIDVWNDEIDKHLDADWKCQVRMINYEELVARHKQYYKEASKLGKENLMIVVDEIHRIKKRGNITSRSVRTLGKRARYKIGLTGTPLGQGIQDAWAYFDFIDKSVFGKYSSTCNHFTGEMLKDPKTGQPLIGFEDKYLIKGGYRDTKVVGLREENMEEFYEKFHARSYRITLREARGKSNPLKIRRKSVEFDLDGPTREIYEELESELIVEVNRKKVKVPVVIALIMKLQQLTGGFVITEDGSPEIVGSEKLRRLLQLAKTLKSERKKIVIVCRFLYEIERIRARLQSRGISCQVVSGGNRFDKRFEEDAVIMQIQMGCAVDMSASDHTIFYSSDYSYLNHEQVKFRILNWDKPMASFYYLRARDTIDEQIYEAVTRKKNVADVALDKYRRKRRP